MSAAHTKIKEKPKRMCPRPGTETEPPRRRFSVGKCGSCGTGPNASRSCSVIHQNSRERKEQNKKELAEHSHRPNTGDLFALTVPQSPASAVTNHRTLGRGRGAKTTEQIPSQVRRATSPRSRCWGICSFWRRSLLPPPRAFAPDGGRNSWHPLACAHISAISAPVFTGLSLGESVCVLSSYKDTDHLGSTLRPGCSPPETLS